MKFSNILLTEIACNLMNKIEAVTISKIRLYGLIDVQRTAQTEGVWKHEILYSNSFYNVGEHLERIFENFSPKAVK